MKENLKKVLDIRRGIIESDMEIHKVLTYSKMPLLAGLYDNMRQELNHVEQSIDDQYMPYISALDGIKKTQDLIIKNAEGKETQSEDLLFIKGCEKNLNEIYRKPIVDTLNLEKKLEFIPETKKIEIGELAKYLEGAFEASGVVEHLKDSLKDIGEIKKCIKKDPMTALGMYMEFLFEDGKRFRQIENYARTVEKGFESKKANLRLYRTGLENEGKGISDELKSINSDDDIKELKTKIDKKLKEYSPKRKNKRN